MNPTGYRATNIILHICNALLVWLILNRLKIPGGFVAALLFALHPVNVESVTWIAQRKTVLSGFFFLISVVWYLKYLLDVPQPSVATDQRTENRSLLLKRWWYWLSLLAFGLAMLSKGSVAFEPLVLLLLVWWLHGRLNKSDFLHSMPFFLVAGCLTLVNIFYQSPDGLIREATFGQRLVEAGAVVWFYLGKALLPIQLNLVYPQWNVKTSNWLWWIPLLATLTTTVVLWWNRANRWCHAMLFAWLFFCAALLPVMRFADVGYMQFSLVADHYQYLALVAMVALLGAAASRLSELPSAYAGWAMASTSIAAAVVVGLLTWEQNRLWADPLALYQASLDSNPDSWLAENNLGLEWYRKGDLAEAAEHYTSALKLNPKYPNAHMNLGIVLDDVGRPNEAIPHFEAALQSNPNKIEARGNYGVALAMVGRLPEAITQFEEGLKLEPDQTGMRGNLGLALLNSRQPEKAIEEFRTVIELDPNLINPHINMAIAYSMLGRSTEAIDYAQRALKLAQAQKDLKSQEMIQAWLQRYMQSQGHTNNGSSITIFGRVTEPVPFDPADLRHKTREE